MSNKMQRYTVHFIWKLLYLFRAVPPPIIRSANNCICSIWYLSHGVLWVAYATHSTQHYIVIHKFMSVFHFENKLVVCLAYSH
jgi:hypothetical protein